MKRTLAFVLEQSSSGSHHLFDPGLIRRAFAAAPNRSNPGSGPIGGPSRYSPIEDFPERPLSAVGYVDGATAVQASELLDSLTERSSIGGQRRCIRRAPDDVQEVFVRLYFDYLGRYMRHQGAALH